ncbi:hypothetical protein BT67DRAFT_309840 [Trichocladium antarcticum]|uniref:Uncharacterized protein n=1 Tax=Trichocladium antarcticum TaxID=1450529 RepID=A0AAN6UJH7_9PEZI|nr:hypothetical protein BT67DRAFT_309840 [Trichocladium antarcticum]
MQCKRLVSLVYPFCSLSETSLMSRHLVCDAIGRDHGRCTRPLRVGIYLSIVCPDAAREGVRIIISARAPESTGNMVLSVCLSCLSRPLPHGADQPILVWTTPPRPRCWVPDGRRGTGWMDTCSDGTFPGPDRGMARRLGAPPWVLGDCGLPASRASEGRWVGGRVARWVGAEECPRAGFVSLEFLGWMGGWVLAQGPAGGT